MKILIIDDNELVVKGIRDFAEDRNWECSVVDFSEYNEKVFQYNPDVIILDWKDDADNDMAGSPILEDVLSSEFRPVIIFSAIEGSIPEIESTKNKSLVFRHSKSDEEVVTSLLLSLEPYINSIADMRQEMNKALIESTKAINSFREMESTPSPEIVKYMLHKRASQFFDNNIFPGEKPPAWIKYEYPPILDNFAVADILRKVSSESNLNAEGVPEEYMLLLTPSCDLARATGDKQVLVAQAIPKDQYNNGDWMLTETQNVDAGKGKDKVSKIISTLSLGYHNSQIPIAELPGKIPYMAIDLKNINIIILNKIAKSKEEFNPESHDCYRVASVSSPYREQMVWSYMNSACRPGVPDRDFYEWAKGMVIR